MYSYNNMIIDYSMVVTPLYLNPCSFVCYRVYRIEYL